MAGLNSAGDTVYQLRLRPRQPQTNKPGANFHLIIKCINVYTGGVLFATLRYIQVGCYLRHYGIYRYRGANFKSLLKSYQIHVECNMNCVHVGTMYVSCIFTKYCISVYLYLLNLTCIALTANLMYI